MHDEWIDRLSEYLDDELPGSEREACAAHLAGCETCRAALGELRTVRLSARNAPVVRPTADLWPGVAARLGPTRRRVSVSVAGAIAAGLFVAVASGLATWAIVTAPAPSASRTSQASVPLLAPVSLQSEAYDRAAAELLSSLRSKQAGLNPRTVDTIERNLATIDRAIAQTRSALDRDPANAALVAYLAEKQRSRLAVLRQADRFAPDAQ